eukprot:m.75620 g.75620  ORF g.75620 m.75620 type:complete len:180 (-) comp16179_c0_seq6:2684-3223(-)
MAHASSSAVVVVMSYSSALSPGCGFRDVSSSSAVSQTSYVGAGGGASMVALRAASEVISGDSLVTVAYTFPVGGAVRVLVVSCAKRLLYALGPVGWAAVSASSSSALHAHRIVSGQHACDRPGTQCWRGRTVLACGWRRTAGGWERGRRTTSPPSQLLSPHETSVLQGDKMARAQVDRG